MGTLNAVDQQKRSWSGTHFNIKDELDAGLYNLEALLPVARDAAKDSVFNGEDSKRLVAFIDGAKARLDETIVNNTAS